MSEKINQFQEKVLDLEEQNRVLQQELDTYRANLGIAASSRRQSESKVTELTEQKKVLVREVKAARKVRGRPRSCMP